MQLVSYKSTQIQPLEEDHSQPAEISVRLDPLLVSGSALCSLPCQHTFHMACITRR